MWLLYVQHFKELSNSFINLLHHFRFSSAMYEAFSFSTSCYCCRLIIAIQMSMKWYICSLYWHFSNDKCFAAYHVLIVHLYVFFRNMSSWIFCPFLIGLFILLLLNFKMFLIYSEHKSHIRYMTWKYFLSILWVVFSLSFTGIACNTKVL